MKWNYQAIFDNKERRSLLPENMEEQYFSNLGEPQILHYAAKRQLGNLHSFIEVVFWKYARQSPYYEWLLDKRLLSVKYGQK